MVKPLPSASCAEVSCVTDLLKLGRNAFFNVSGIAGDEGHGLFVRVEVVFQSSLFSPHECRSKNWRCLEVGFVGKHGVLKLALTYLVGLRMMIGTKFSSSCR